MNVFLFHLFYIPPVVIPLVWLLWKKQLKDAALFIVLTGVAYILWLLAVINRPIVITRYLTLFFETLKGWWS